MGPGSNFIGQNFITPGIAATAAGTTTITGPTIDHATGGGNRSVVHGVIPGTLTAGQTGTIRTYEGDASDMSDEAEVTALRITPADGDVGVYAVEIFKPSKRYSRIKWLRGGANAVITGGFTILGGDRKGGKLANLAAPTGSLGNLVAAGA